jgi:hyperosmotically inducible protein
MSSLPLVNKEEKLVMHKLTIGVAAVCLTAALPVLGSERDKASRTEKQYAQVRKENTAERSRTETETVRSSIAHEVRHELVMLPYYGVFDHLAFRVEGDSVILVGKVTRPTLKSSAERVVQDIEGVETVVNNIEVLPLSPNDDRIRLAAYRTIYGHASLNRYAMRAVPPIHIIVENGKLTLEGVVANEADKNIANMQARSVPGVFEVTNHLRVESDEQK